MVQLEHEIDGYGLVRLNGEIRPIQLVHWPQQWDELEVHPKKLGEVAETGTGCGEGRRRLWPQVRRGYTGDTYPGRLLPRASGERLQQRRPLDTLHDPEVNDMDLGRRARSLQDGLVGGQVRKLGVGAGVIECLVAERELVGGETRVYCHRGLRPAAAREAARQRVREVERHALCGVPIVGGGSAHLDELRGSEPWVSGRCTGAGEEGLEDGRGAGGVQGARRGTRCRGSDGGRLGKRRRSGGLWLGRRVDGGHGGGGDRGRDGRRRGGEDEALEVGVREDRCVPDEAVHPHIGVEVRGAGEVREHRVGRGRADEGVGEEMVRLGPRAAAVGEGCRRDLAVRGRRGRRHRRRLARRERERHRRRRQVVPLVLLLLLLLLNHLLRDGHEVAAVGAHVRHGAPRRSRWENRGMVGGERRGAAGGFGGAVLGEWMEGRTGGTAG